MRILHTMLRVGELKRSIDFYTKVLGMRVLRQRDYPDGRFTLAFVGYGDEDKEAVLELNVLNDKCGEGLIETDQREAICQLLLVSAQDAGVGTDDDITEEWRRW